MDMASQTMAMATSTPTADSGMSMSGQTMDMSSMTMAFFSATNTAFLSTSWQPSTVGQYIGTCIFLIALSAVFRGLMALRTNLVPLLDWWKHKQDPAGILGKHEIRHSIGLEGKRPRPWRINESITRACIDTVLAGVGYLL